MSVKRVDDLDLVVPFVTFKDQRETMERPFFSISKQKRIKPIEYVSPDGLVRVRVLAVPQIGMATIWDADILIWAASQLIDMRRRGVNEIPRKLTFMPYELLTAIGRKTGGDQYKRLKEALSRLGSTRVITNIRANPRTRKDREFSWISDVTDVVDEETKTSKGMSITLSDWFYEGVLMDGGVLSIDPIYFDITGGRERWLYRVARKHAGGSGQEGFAISLPTLFEKSGAEGTYRRFKFEVAKIARENALPGFTLLFEEKGGAEPHLRMVRREIVEAAQVSTPKAKVPRKRKKTAALPLFQRLSDETLTACREKHRGFDPYSLKAEFDAWLADDPSREPAHYEKAFLGWVKRYLRTTD